MRRSAIVAVAAGLGLATAALADGPPLGRSSVTRLVAYKARHRLEAYAGDKIVRTYAIAIGVGGAGGKRIGGDARTPEGSYRIDDRHAGGDYHRFLHISYPNATDRAAFEKARREGRIPRDATIGSAVGLHGEKRGYGWFPLNWFDWTAGCIAVSNAEIEELYDAVAPNAPIEIHP